MRLLPLLALGFKSSEYHMGIPLQGLPDGTFDYLFDSLYAPGGSQLTGPS
jgi:hypothetical protein